MIGDVRQRVARTSGEAVQAGTGWGDAGRPGLREAAAQIGPRLPAGTGPALFLQVPGAGGGEAMGLGVVEPHT